MQHAGTGCYLHVKGRPRFFVPAKPAANSLSTLVHAPISFSADSDKNDKGLSEQMTALLARERSLAGYTNRLEI